MDDGVAVDVADGGHDAVRGVVAPKAYDRAMNAETFEAWLEHHLLPTLEEGDIVVLDNLKKPESGGNPGQEKLHRSIPAALQPGLQPHRDGDLQTEKRATKTGRARRRRPYRNLGGLRRSLQAGRLPKLFQGLRLSSRRTPSPRHNLNGFRSNKVPIPPHLARQSATYASRIRSIEKFSTIRALAAAFRPQSRAPSDEFNKAAARRSGAPAGTTHPVSPTM